MKRILAVTGTMVFHFVALTALTHFLQVRATEYLLWILLLELTFLNYDLKK